MVDESASEAGSDALRCPWCSAELPAIDAATCPSCGAKLGGDADAAVPGVTAIDRDAIERSAREPTPRPRNRILDWISGEPPEEVRPAPPGAVSLPPLEVRREILRLELEAEVAALAAEADAMAAEARLASEENGEPMTIADADATADPGEMAGATVAGEATEPVPEEAPRA